MHLGFDLLHLHASWRCVMGKLAMNTVTLGAHCKREMFIALIGRFL